MGSNYLGDALLSVVSPKVIDVFTPLGYTPHAKQEIFHDLSHQRIGAILFGGAAGGGKSCALLMEAIHNAVNFPNMRIGCIRRTYGELEESFLAELAKRGYAKELGATWNQTDKVLKFPNRSIINFTYAENEVDASRLLGGEYQLFCIDEAGQMPPIVIQHVEERLRSGTRGLPVIGLRLATNPGGTGHKYLRDRFIAPTRYGKDIVVDSNDRTVAFIQSLYTDNPYVDKGYEKILNAIPDENRRAAMRDGDWDAMVGAFFCCDDQTEILTDRGFRSIIDVPLGTRVATLSPAGEMTFEQISGSHSFDFDGELFTHSGRLDFAVTPGHRMWVKPYQGGEWGLVPVEGLPRQHVYDKVAHSWSGTQRSDTVVIDAHELGPVDLPAVTAGDCRSCGSDPGIPRLGMCEPCYRAWVRAGRPGDFNGWRKQRNHPITQSAKQKSFTFDRGDWCEFLGWYLSKGSLIRWSKNQRTPGRIKGFSISQRKDAEKIQRIRGLLSRMGFCASMDNQGFDVNSVVMGEYLSRFGNDADRFIPSDILDNENRHLRRLFDALVDGDGHRTEAGTIIYSSASKRLADDFQVLCIKLGLASSVTRVSLNERNPKHRDAYRVTVYTDAHTENCLLAEEIRRTPYVGRVGCVTVEPHHTVMVRRNGKTMWTGNSTFQRMRHVVPAFDPPKEWQRYCGVDYGFRDPFAAEWGAVDNDGRVWMYREIYATEVDAPNQAKLILEAEENAKEVGVVRVADPSMWGARGTPLTIADIYGMEGCGIAKADNDRLNGWSRFFYFLSEAPACDYHRSLGWTTCPLIHFMEDRCPNLIDAIPNLPRSKTRPDDAETREVDDHGIDATRYLLMMAGTSARPVIYNEIPSNARQSAHHAEVSAAYRVPDHTPTVMGFSGTLALEL